ncbi:MAG: mechanosensitive ion channel [Gemmatimonas sp.]|nr:mechanosensitive ion channel [Gemmatimonas sp.]
MNGFEFLDWELLGNPVRAWLYALTIALAVFVALRLVQRLLIRQITRISAFTSNHWVDLLVTVLSVTRSWLRAALALWAAALVLDLPVRIFDLIVTVAILAILAQIGIWGTTAIRSYVKFYDHRNLADDAASVMTVRALGFLGSVALWTTILLVGLDSLGFNVTTLIAGLGIGGIAVALALQNILGDVFASLSIVFDKPFVVGDFIIVDDLLGTVDHVGLKTTRLRSLSGEQLVFANSDLLMSRIRNFKRMFERRVAFSFGVEYGTPFDQLEWIPSAVRQIIEELPDTRIDRAHFKGYGDSSLDFEVVYYVLQPDFNLYMDRQQSINLSLYRLFEERDIAFAFPTRTLHVVPAGLAQVE